MPPPGRNILLSLPPWRLLANLMAWSLDHMPSALLRPFVMSFVTTALAPSLDLFAEGALLINKRGERFTDERDKPAFALPDQPDKVALYLARPAALRICSAAGRISSRPRRASPMPMLTTIGATARDIFTSRATLDALAEKLAMPAAALAETVRTYNASAGNRPPLGEGPYVALGPLRAVFVHAEGGLAVDREHRVLGERRRADRRASMPPARPGRAACCSRATATISAGPSRPAGAQAAMRRLRCRY